MASTKTAAKTVWMVPFPATEITVSAITAGLEEDYSHGGPDGVTVQKVEMDVTHPAASGDPVFLERHTENDSLTSNTCAIKFSTVAGGDLTGAIVNLRFIFDAMKSGGIS
jgi:hypothetical protein